MAVFRRRTAVERICTTSDASRIMIDHGNGSQPSEMLLSRNNMFAIAWNVARVVEQETSTRQWHKVQITCTIPVSHEAQSQILTLDVPDWAKKKLFKQIIAHALKLGWKGECPRPAPTSAFR